MKIGQLLFYAQNMLFWIRYICICSGVNPEIWPQISGCITFRSFHVWMELTASKPSPLLLLLLVYWFEWPWSFLLFFIFAIEFLMSSYSGSWEYLISWPPFLQCYLMRFSRRSLCSGLLVLTTKQQNPSSVLAHRMYYRGFDISCLPSLAKAATLTLRSASVLRKLGSSSNLSVGSSRTRISRDSSTRSSSSHILTAQTYCNRGYLDECVLALRDLGDAALLRQDVQGQLEAGLQMAKQVVVPAQRPTAEQGLQALQQQQVLHGQVDGLLPFHQLYYRWALIIRIKYNQSTQVQVLLPPDAAFLTGDRDSPSAPVLPGQGSASPVATPPSIVLVLLRGSSAVYLQAVLWPLGNLFVYIQAFLAKGSVFLGKGCVFLMQGYEFLVKSEMSGAGDLFSGWKAAMGDEFQPKVATFSYQNLRASGLKCWQFCFSDRTPSGADTMLYISGLRHSLLGWSTSRYACLCRMIYQIRSCLRTVGSSLHSSPQSGLLASGQASKAEISLLRSQLSMYSYFLGLFRTNYLAALLVLRISGSLSTQTACSQYLLARGLRPRVFLDRCVSRFLLIQESMMALASCRLYSRLTSLAWGRSGLAWMSSSVPWVPQMICWPYRSPMRENSSWQWPTNFWQTDSTWDRLMNLLEKLAICLKQFLHVLAEAGGLLSRQKQEWMSWLAKQPYFTLQVLALGMSWQRRPYSIVLLPLDLSYSASACSLFSSCYFLNVKLSVQLLVAIVKVS